MISFDTFKRYWSYVLVDLMFLIGIVIHLLHPGPKLLSMLTPGFLFLTGAFVLYHSFPRKGTKFIVWVLIAYAGAFLLEVIGVATGAVFGEYSYGGTLGPKLWSVPPVIGFNWVLVIAGSMALSMRFLKGSFMAPVLAGSIAMAFDMVLEPVAIELDYWTWSGGDIPLQNYLAWAVIGFILASLHSAMRLRPKKGLLMHYLLMQVLFFAVMRLTFVLA